MHNTLTPAPKNVFWTPEAKMAYILLTPALIVLLAFMLYPIIYVFLMAFCKTTKLGKIMGFTGFDNFRLLFKNKAFWEVTIRSFVWTAISVTSKTLVGLVIALLLNVKFAGRKIYRTLVILPWATSVPISVLLWQWIYQSEFGLLNHTLKLIGIKNPPMWLAYPKSAFFATIYVDIWIGIPFMALVFLVGLQAIPQDIYESADVDGASILKKFWHITLPMLNGVHCAKWFRKRAPSAAKASRFGVLTTGCPRTDKHSPRHISAVMNKRFFGFIIFFLNHFSFWLAMMASRFSHISLI